MTGSTRVTTARAGRRFAHRLAIWTVLLAVITALGLSGNAPAKAAGEGAVDAYGGCLVANKGGDLLIIIDESRSLETNDPQNARIASAKYLLTQLNAFAERAKVTLDVSVAGFSHDFSQAQDWTKLDSAGLSKTLATVDGFATRPKGFETDYWMALEGARRSLADHNPKGDRCQGLVWITDGGLDVDWRKNAQERNDYGNTKPYLGDTKLDSESVAQKAEAEAERQICRDGGLADQLRSSKVTLFGVGLSGEEKPDYTLMRSIALGGDAGGQHCGKITKPPGSFTEAANIDELLFEFDKFATPNQEKKTTEAGICQGKPCPEQRHTFVLDDSVQSVHVLGSADTEEIEVYLVTPAEKNLQLTRKGIGETASVDAGDVKINYSWQSERTVVIDMAAESGTNGWSGPWSVVFVDPTGKSPDAKSRTSIAISGDVFPSWPKVKETTLRSGEPAEIQLGLVNADGEAIDPTKLLGKVGMDVTLETADGNATEVAKGLDREGIAKALTLDLTQVSPGQATLVLSLSITTADAKDAKGKTVPGTALQPQSVRIPLQVEPPVGFPTLGQQVNFGALEGKAERVAGTLAVTGPGCVWVEGNGSPNILAGPEEIGEVSIASTHNSAETCFRVEEGQTAELPLTLTTAGEGNGTLNAEISVKIAPVDLPDRATDAKVLATASFEKPLNPVNFALTLIVAAILGPGIPLLLLYLMKFLTSKIPGRALLAEEYPVTIEAGQVLRDGQRFELRDRDLTAGMVPLSNSGSRTANASSVTLQAKTGPSPFGEGFVQVESPGRVGASSGDTRPHGKNLSARLPLDVHNHWVLLHDPRGPADQATVLLLVGGDAPPEMREKLVDDLNSRVPEVLDSLRSQAGVSVGGAGEAAPFGGADAGPQHGGPAPFAFGPDLSGPQGQQNPFGGQGQPPASGMPPAPGSGGTPMSAASANPFGQAGQANSFGQSGQGQQPGQPGQGQQPGQSGQGQYPQTAPDEGPEPTTHLGGTAPVGGQQQAGHQQSWGQQPAAPQGAAPGWGGAPSPDPGWHQNGPAQQAGLQSGPGQQPGPEPGPGQQPGWGIPPAAEQGQPEQGQPGQGQQGWNSPAPAQPQQQWGHQAMPDAQQQPQHQQPHQPQQQQPQNPQPQQPQHQQAPPQQWGQPGPETPPQQQWGQPEQPQQGQPQQPQQGQPQQPQQAPPDEDRFRPDAPPPGTQIKNPFE